MVEQQETHWFVDIQDRLKAVYEMPRDNVAQALERFKQFAILVTEYEAPFERLYHEICQDGETGQAPEAPAGGTDQTGQGEVMVEG